MMYNIQDLIIEVTRRCNMQCDHCLRGDAQGLDMNMKYVRKLFDNVRSIGSITFTGGEPSLVPHIIDAIVEEAQERGIDIGNFYIATNAKEVSNEFTLALLKLWNYCSENETSQVDVSNDGYHECNEQGFKKLSALRFVGKKQEHDGEFRDEVIMAGRALENFDSDRRLYLSKFEIEDDQINEAIVYLNCKGNILGECNLSFGQQDDPRVIVGHVNRIRNFGAACERYNARVKVAEEFVNSHEKSIAA